MYTKEYEEVLEELIDAQLNYYEAGTSMYLDGFTNGLKLAQATYLGEEPEYVENVNNSLHQKWTKKGLKADLQEELNKEGGLDLTEVQNIVTRLLYLKKVGVV